MRADRQVRGIAGQVVSRQVLPHRGDVLGQRGGDLLELSRALAVPEAVLEAVQPGEVLVVDAAGVAVGQAVDRQAQVAEAVVGGADAFPVELGGQPVLLRLGDVVAPQVGLDRGDLGCQVRELGGGVGLVAVVRRGQVLDGDRLHGDRSLGARGGAGDLDRLRGRRGLRAHQALEGIRAAAQRGGERGGRARAYRLDLTDDRAGRVVEVDLACQPGVVGDRERVRACGPRGPLGRAAGFRHGHGHSRGGGRGGQRGDRRPGGEGRDRDQDPGHRPRAPSGEALPLAGGRGSLRRRSGLSRLLGRLFRGLLRGFDGRPGGHERRDDHGEVGEPGGDLEHGHLR